MAVNKTQKTKNSVSAFIKRVEKERQSDCNEIIAMMTEVTNAMPAMWGESIIGFGDTHFKYASGRELDWFKIGFSPRKKDISLYVLYQSSGLGELLDQLGPHRSGKGCLYIKSLEGIDLKILKTIFEIGANN